MTRTDAFAKDMCDALTKKCGLDWRCGKPVKGNRECVDVIGSKDNKDHVLIEVELRRGTPLGNVVKVWKQISLEKENGEGTLAKRVILFQAFSRFYSERSTKRKNAEFIGEQMSQACHPHLYVSLSMDYLPGKRRAGQSVMRGGGRRKKHAMHLARRIASKLRKIGL